jgi:hypothetical protein
MCKIVKIVFCRIGAKPSFDCGGEFLPARPAFEFDRQKFGGKPTFAEQPPVRPTFRGSNLGGDNPAPKFGLPGFGPRNPVPAAQPRFPPIQRQGSFGRSGGEAGLNGSGLRFLNALNSLL